MGWNYLSCPKLQRLHRWSLGMDKLFHPTLYWSCDYLSVLGLKLNHVSKRGPRCILRPHWWWSTRVRARYIASYDSSKYPHNDVIMSAMASQNTSLTIAYSTVYSGADQRNHQSSASLAFVRGIHRWPVNSPHKGPVTRKRVSFDDVIMWSNSWTYHYLTIPNCTLC